MYFIAIAGECAPCAWAEAEAVADDRSPRARGSQPEDVGPGVDVVRRGQRLGDCQGQQSPRKGVLVVSTVTGWCRVERGSDGGDNVDGCGARASFCSLV